ncbi:oligosaccharide flippase family protein [Thermus albus]|uniref:oligosaccharide flippase family protein n=1 Tax=Thermus albus TaxID=2908146 RepID=UPI001FAAF6C6|nr:oligosaccharide flippase family protein [Thermus albus]
MGSSFSRLVLFLYFLHGLNQALGFVTVPYLARTLGPEVYGQVAFAQGLVSYLLVLVNYSFELSASRKVATIDNPEQVTENIGRVVVAQGFLAALGFGLLLGLYPVPSVQRTWHLLLPFYGLVIAQAFSLNWLFWGRGLVLLPLLLEMGQRLLTIVALFLWVRGPEGGFVYALIASTTALVTSGASWLIAVRFYMGGSPNFIRRLLPRWASVSLTLREGWWLFLAQLGSTLTMGGNAFLLGLYTTPIQVAQYAAAEKLVITVSALLNPLFRAFYPRFLRKEQPSPLALGRKALIAFFLLGVILSLGLFLMASPLVRIVFGPGYEEASSLVRILAFWIALTALSTVWGGLFLVPLGLDRFQTLFVLLGGMFHLTLVFLLAPSLAGIGIAFSLLASASLTAFGQALFLWQKTGIPPFMGIIRGGKTKE